MTKPAVAEPTLTDEQRKALAYVIAGVLCGKPVVALAGSAGTGKTTILKELVAQLTKRHGIEVIVAATTHKAARVLWSKGVIACTSHSATQRPIFKPPYDTLGELFDVLHLGVKADPPEVLNKLIAEYGRKKFRAACEAAQESGIYAGFRALGIYDSSEYVTGYAARFPREGVLIIDEASMLGSEDLDKAKSVFERIILVGDENQLPPVQSSPVFWEVKDRIALTQIHRQAAGSQPLKIAQMLLAGGNKIAFNSSAPIDSELCDKGVPVIVWRNVTRERLTHQIREKLGFRSKQPQVGEVLVCRNSMDRVAKSRGLINNSMWTVVEVNGRRFDLMGEDEIVVHWHSL